LFEHPTERRAHENQLPPGSHQTTVPSSQSPSKRWPRKTGKSRSQRALCHKCRAGANHKGPKRLIFAVAAARGSPRTTRTDAREASGRLRGPGTLT
jgi:hypothetical protein